MRMEPPRKPETNCAKEFVTKVHRCSAETMHVSVPEYLKLLGGLFPPSKTAPARQNKTDSEAEVARKPHEKVSTPSSTTLPQSRVYKGLGV